MTVTLDDLELARRRLSGIAKPTPLIRSETLSHLIGGEVFIKWAMDGLKFESFSTCSVRSTMPLIPNEASVCPVFASSEINS